jgi:hypothetical protein
MSKEGKAISFTDNLTDDPEVCYTDGHRPDHVPSSSLRKAGAGGVVRHRRGVARPGRARRAVPSKGSRVVVMGRLQQRTWTAEDGSAGHRRGRSRRAGAEPPLGDDDHDQNHEKPGAVASSTSDAMVRDVGEACWRSAPSCPCC